MPARKRRRCQRHIVVCARGLSPVEIERERERKNKRIGRIIFVAKNTPNLPRWAAAVRPLLRRLRFVARAYATHQNIRLIRFYDSISGVTHRILDIGRRVFCPECPCFFPPMYVFFQQQ